MRKNIVDRPHAPARANLQSSSRQTHGKSGDGLRLLFELRQDLVDRERPVIHGGRLSTSLRRKLMCEGGCPAAVTQRMHFHPDSGLPFAQLQCARTARHPKVPMMAANSPGQFTLASND